jgi:hypothetical protein
MKNSIKKTWDESDLQTLQWKETYITDEIPKDDCWDTFATRKKLELEEKYREWGVPKEGTLHYMCIKPELTENLRSILSEYQGKKYNYNFLKLTPGCQLMWHFDTYATFVKFNQITEDQIGEVQRTAIMMKDWNHGQVLEIDGSIFSHWKAGDTFIWKAETWHGLCNFGPSEIIVAQITFL